MEGYHHNNGTCDKFMHSSNKKNKFVALGIVLLIILYRDWQASFIVLSQTIMQNYNHIYINIFPT